MLRSVNKLEGFAITAVDGAIGEIKDFYFDDERWTIRYLVVSTGTFYEARHVLISPISIRQVDWETNQIFVDLTARQVKNSPDIDTHKPVSRQHETALTTYYGYPNYWTGPYLWGATAYPAALVVPPVEGGARVSQESAAAASRKQEESGDVHLRSAKEVTGYHIEAVDGEIGQVDDFIVEEENWSIRYLVVETGNWWSGRRVLVAPSWIERISWTESKVFAGLTREAIRSSPEYDEPERISREYEEQLHRHYGRPRYWDDER